MLKRLLGASRYMMILPVIATLLGSFALIVYQAVVLAATATDIVDGTEVSQKAVKVFAVGVVETVDVFLIAIAVYIISIGLYALFVDETLIRPRWLELHNLEDLKAHLISVVIAVLAVLFLREAVAWDGSRDIVSFGIATATVIAALAFFLLKDNANRS